MQLLAMASIRISEHLLFGSELEASLCASCHISLERKERGLKNEQQSSLETKVDASGCYFCDLAASQLYPNAKVEVLCCGVGCAVSGPITSSRPACRLSDGMWTCQ